MSKSHLNFENIPRKGIFFIIKLHEIQYNEFKRVQESYNLTYEDINVKMEIYFRNDSFELIGDKTPLGMKNKTLNKGPVLLRKHKKGYIDFMYELDLNNIKKHKFKEGPLKITYTNHLYSIFIIVKLTRDKINELLNKIKVENDYKRNILVKVESETKADYFDQDKNPEKRNMVISKNPNPILKRQLEKYGIYLTHPNAFKRCFNCANYNNKECTALNRIEVSSNHICKRFYSYKTYLGGGFSSK
ncbi:hypothetical protein [Bacillus sp. AFS096315]|uniref:hypothetical protein n=1 Tax=Bacillus sp. AFS096315 TaxID=2033517 RepID=UPI000BEC4B17|nr:hypothetical protein [Bacillus sp. AFS096315]PEC50292.1 hypothetical protein CON00_07000 [Bacillus sp. AFS096315]